MKTEEYIIQMSSDFYNLFGSDIYLLSCLNNLCATLVCKKMTPVSKKDTPQKK